jgi:hypothetical protein
MRSMVEGARLPLLRSHGPERRQSGVPPLTKPRILRPMIVGRPRIHPRLDRRRPHIPRPLQRPQKYLPPQRRLLPSSHFPSSRRRPGPPFLHPASCPPPRPRDAKGPAAPTRSDPLPVPVIRVLRIRLTENFLHWKGGLPRPTRRCCNPLPRYRRSQARIPSRFWIVPDRQVLTLSRRAFLVAVYRGDLLQFAVRAF